MKFRITVRVPHLSTPLVPHPAEYYEKKAAHSIAQAMEQMKTTFGEKAFEACRAKHADLFGRLP